AIQQDRLADDTGVAAEATRPEAVVQNDRGSASGLIVLGREWRAELGARAKERKERRGDAHAVDALRRGVACHVEAGANCRGDAAERRVLLLDVEVLAEREPIARDVQSG